MARGRTASFANTAGVEIALRTLSSRGSLTQSGQPGDRRPLPRTHVLRRDVPRLDCSQYIDQRTICQMPCVLTVWSNCPGARTTGFWLSQILALLCRGRRSLHAVQGRLSAPLPDSLAAPTGRDRPKPVLRTCRGLRLPMVLAQPGAGARALRYPAHWFHTLVCSWAQPIMANGGSAGFTATPPHSSNSPPRRYTASTNNTPLHSRATAWFNVAVRSRHSSPFGIAFAGHTCPHAIPSTRDRCLGQCSGVAVGEGQVTCRRPWCALEMLAG